MAKENTTPTILTILGAVIFLIGILGGYISSNPYPEYFIVWMGLAFIGIIIALSGFAVGSKGEEKSKNKD